MMRDALGVKHQVMNGRIVGSVVTSLNVQGFVV